MTVSRYNARNRAKYLLCTNPLSTQINTWAKSLQATATTDYRWIMQPSFHDACKLIILQKLTAFPYTPCLLTERTGTHIMIIVNLKRNNTCTHTHTHTHRYLLYDHTSIHNMNLHQLYSWNILWYKNSSIMMFSISIYNYII